MENNIRMGWCRRDSLVVTGGGDAGHRVWPEPSELASVW